MNTPPDMPGDGNATSGRAAPGTAVAANHPTQEEKFDFWRTAHRALRGRYAFALLIACGGAISGAWAGSLFGQRLYSATGLVRIAAALPQVMRETDQNRPMVMFDGFIEAQRELMVGSEMIHAAMQEDAWQQATSGGHALSEKQFAASLKVETRPRSDHLKVIFKNKDPSITAPAVRSIITAYQKAFTNGQQRADRQRTEQLEARRSSLNADLKKLEDVVSGDGLERSVAEIDPLYLAASDRVKRLTNALADVQLALAGEFDASPKRGSRPLLAGDVVDEELLHAYAAELARVEIQLAQGVSRGLGPAHPDMVWLTNMVQECRTKVARAAQRCDARLAPTPSGAMPTTLRDRESNLRYLVKTAENEANRLATRRTQLKGFEDQAAALRLSLAETDSRLDALATEAALGGRLTIISGGDSSMTAVLDNRAKAAAMGGLAGVALPFGLIVARGTRRRRYRFCDEVALDLRDHTPFVAVLPDIREPGPLNAVAAHSIHDVRVRLQPRNSDDKRAYLITSVTAGEGKSSLAAALGLSFAAAGFRTLLVDGDLTSRRLTRGFDASDSSGMIEAGAGGEPLIRWNRAGLSFLAAGCGGPEDSCRLAPSATGRLLAVIRERFDVVLIDSDSILTGLTASVLAPHVDGVILTLAHGQEQALVQNAVRHVQMLGASLSAAVFNRADSSDLSAVLSDQSHSPAAATRAVPERLSRFGPLVSAILASLSLTREEDLDLMPAGISLAKSDDARRNVGAAQTRTEEARRNVA